MVFVVVGYVYVCLSGSKGWGGDLKGIRQKKGQIWG